MKKMYFMVFPGFCLVAWLFTACNSSPNPQKIASHIDSVRVGKNTIKDSSVNDTFLLHPFNLHAFMKKKGSAQGGRWKGETYFYKPPFKGFYDGYIMFSPAFKGYLGKNIKDTVYMENSFEITTYRPEGTNANRFNWNVAGEVLIEVKAKYNDFDLPELAFVGLSASEASKKLGLDYFVKDSCMVYSQKNAVLILKVNLRRVEWLKYVLLNQQMSLNSSLLELTDFDK